MLPEINRFKSYNFACLLFVVSFAFLISLQKVYNYDIWWHLRIGDYMLDKLVVPTSDFLSFSTEGAPWLNLYWLSDPLFALVHKVFGIDGLLIFKSATISLAAAFLYLLIARGGLSPFWSTLLVFAVLEISRFRFMLRPLFFQFVGIVFLLWFIYHLRNVRYKEFLLFAVIILWNGLHGSAFIVQVVLVMLFVECMIDRLTGSSRYQSGQLKSIFLLFVVASIALLLNPNGFELYKEVYGRYFLSDVITGSYVAVEEHQGLVLAENLPIILLTAGALASFFARRENFRPLSFFLVLAFAVLAYGSMRYVAIAAFVMAAIIGINLSGCQFWNPFQHGRPRWLGNVCLMFLFSTGIALLLWTFQGGRVYEFGLGVNKSRYPYAAVGKLADLEVEGNVFNSWKFGGFLQWSLPEVKTFIDGRCLPEQLELFDRFSRIELRDFAQYLSDNNVKAGLIDRRYQRDVNLFNDTPGYRAVHMDDLSVLFVRKELLPAEEDKTTGVFKYLRLGGYEYEYLRPLAKGPEAATVEAEIMAALKSSPDNFFINFLLGFFLDAKGDPAATRQYLIAAEKNPQFAHTHFNIATRAARTALKTGAWERAVEIAEEGLGYQRTGELYFLLGAANHQLGRLKEAEEAYQMSLEKEDNAQVISNLGFLNLTLNNEDVAIKHFTALLDRNDPKYQESALYGLILAFEGLGDKAKAQQLSEEFAETYPSSKFLKKLEGLNNSE